MQIYIRVCTLPAHFLGLFQELIRRWTVDVSNEVKTPQEKGDAPDNLSATGNPREGMKPTSVLVILM